MSGYSVDSLRARAPEDGPNILHLVCSECGHGWPVFALQLTEDWLPLFDHRCVDGWGRERVTRSDVSHGYLPAFLGRGTNG